MTADTRVVFDCNVYIQALGSPRGPAGHCVQLAIAGKVSLFISPGVLAEARDVTSRPTVVSKLQLVASRVEEFFQAIEVAATLLEGFPESFAYQRDPSDAHYVNLALAADAKFIVSRDKDLLDLMDTSSAEAEEFGKRYPGLRILGPVQFIRETGD